MSEKESQLQWLPGLRTYVIASLAGHAPWEVLQLPLYELFWTGTPGEIAFAVLHCTGGDLLIAASSLLTALLLLGNSAWPQPSRNTFRVAVATMVIGVAYTVFSEWWNTAVRAGWSYTQAMPLAPPLGTGLAPLMQWIVIPAVALWLATRRARHRQEK